MTRILDSLEAKGYVERVPDEKDRRRVMRVLHGRGPQARP